MKQYKKQIVGILGGMGPEATSLFLYKIINKTPAENDQDHIKCIIYNDPEIPDRTGAIIGNNISPVNQIKDGLVLLKNSGVHLIAIPCVTAHYYFSEFSDCIDIKILNLVDETLNYIRINYPEIKNIGVLATKGTYISKIFDNSLEIENYNVINPNEESQNVVMEAIYGKNGIKAGIKDNRPKDSILKIASNLINEGAELIIGGCTEIPIVISKEDLPVPFIDTLSVLAEAVIRYTGLTPKTS